MEENRQWTADPEGWLDDHTSISSAHHGALIQVLTQMEWVYPESEKKKGSWEYDQWVQKNKTLQRNLRLVLAAPDLLEVTKELVSDLFYQIEAKHGPEVASKYPSIVQAKNLIKEVDLEN